MKKLVIPALIILVSLGVYSWINGKRSAALNASQKTDIIIGDDIPQDKLDVFRGSGMMKQVTRDSQKITIIYFGDYSEYKKNKPRSRFTQIEFSSYWDTGHAIKKNLIDTSIRAMKDFEGITESEVSLSRLGKEYQIHVKKSDFEKYTRIPFDDVVENWTKAFSDKYVYDKGGRNAFFSKFGSVH